MYAVGAIQSQTLPGPIQFGLVYWGLTPQQQPGSYQGGEMMMMMLLMTMMLAMMAMMAMMMMMKSVFIIIISPP